MNNKLAPIFARRSIRKYQDRPVSDDMIQDLLEAAMAAPSANGKDPWRFIVIKDRDMLGRVAGGLKFGGMLADAGVGFVVCGDINAAHSNSESYMLQDCSAAIENLLLAASVLGLGAVWLGVHPREERLEHIRNLFDLPENIIPISAIAVGWPADEAKPRTRYAADYVHFESW